MHRILTIIFAACAPAALAAPSTIASGNSYAWDANAGWIEFLPNHPSPGDGVVIADSFVSGDAWSAHIGWINFGDGTPANGIRYGNAAANDSGVNHDGGGNLSGLAWNANSGWINFDWWTGNPADLNRPRINLLDGGFSGYAWSAKRGWINLGTGLLKTNSIQVVDSDNDQISDTWETEKAGNLVDLGANADSDGDGISDVDEYNADTHPLDATDYLHITELIMGGTASDITWRSSPGRLYLIQQSASLAGWSASGQLVPDTGSHTTRTISHPAGSQRFFTVESVLPLQP